jgi:uncharacterized SAM-binding protein YcdF (DUF218 family)
MSYDTAVAMDNTINPDGTLIDDGRARFDKAILLYKKEIARTLTSPGTFDSIDINAATFTHAEAGKRYAISQGVPESKIYKEETPLNYGTKMSDTIGCAFFIKRTLAIPKNWGSLVVVSSDYHIPRVEEIFRFLYGKGFNLAFEKASTDHIDNDQIRRQRSGEAERISKFKEFFRGIPKGDDILIMERLLEGHPLYNKTKKGDVWFP